MANQEHLDILNQGVRVWNKWRNEHRDIQPDLSGADLSNADLNGADFVIACLRGANLREAHLRFADFRRADLNGSILQGADLRDADLKRADLSKTDLSGAILRRATLVETNFSEAILTHCSLYGISVWNVQLAGAIQENLVITSPDEPTITVDNLEVAQFIYLLLNNQKLREVIDTITSKVVLILGRFTQERKPILDALREALRKRNYSPVLFDFEKPASRDTTETVSTLAHMARFVIADITDARSIPQELKTIVPNLPSVPVQPLILNSQYEYSMFEHFTRFPWVLPVYRYADEESLLHSLKVNIIEPAEQKAKELEKR